jgi:hypothetical protein
MLEKLQGKVETFKAISRRNVQFELDGGNRVIELLVEDPWVINKGDNVTVVGEMNPTNGKFYAFVYRNNTKGVYGKTRDTYVHGLIYVIAGIFFCWGIFPLFTHVPTGIRMMKEGRKIREAAIML